MPHQCLKCGKVFDEGSLQLLKGCPDCQGNRFFFTKQPLDEQQRNQISKELTKDDITSQITDIIKEKDRELFDKAGKWVTVKPKDLRKMMEHIHETTKNDTEKRKNLTVLDEEYRRVRLEQLKQEQEDSDAPETIGVERPGTYKIDVKGLLEQEPVIINRDGSYTIHLPSIFKMRGKKE